MPKEISKEVYDAIKEIFKQCYNHRCDECIFCLENEECMFDGKPIDWNGVTEDNGHYFVEDEVTV